MSNTIRVQFRIHPPRRLIDGRHSVVVEAPELLVEPVTLYGETAHQAMQLAHRFTKSFGPCPSVTDRTGSGGPAQPNDASETATASAVPTLGAALGAVGVTAGIAAASDGPLPVGDVVAVFILVGAAVAHYILESHRNQERRRACDEQFERDNEVCRQLPSPTIRAKCFSSAMERYANCLADRRIRRPLETE